MTFVSDRRGRVPFALVGVVLLVGSATFAGVVSQRSPVNVDSRVADVHHETSATVRSALVTAAERAAHATGRAPVVDPANTTYGRVLNESAPVRDALRVRTYRRARAALANVSASRDGLVGTATLPAVDSAADLRRAKRSVRIERRNRTRLAVTLRNVTLTVRRGDRVVERESLSPTVAVETPLLSLVERVETFEARLRGGGTDRGLGRRLTANLYAMAWARGYAQYGGAPISNVVGTRHVALAANAGVLDLQRAVFGRADPRGTDALTRAALEVGATDLLAGVDAANWTDTVLDPAGVADETVPDPVPSGVATRAATQTTTTGVNGTADRAFADLLAGRNGPSLEDVLAEVYEADVRLASRTAVTEREETAEDAPAGDWTVVDTNRSRSATWRRIDGAAPVAAGGHPLETYAWRVERTETVTRTWKSGNRTRTTTDVTRTVHRVAVSVVGDHAATPQAPERGIDAPHEAGGPLAGQNFAGVGERAVARLVTDRGEPRAVGRRALNGTLNTSSLSLSVPRPAGLREWVYRDLMDRRAAARNVTVETERSALRRTNVPARLRARFADQRDDIAAIPASYRSVAQKARVAARSAYLDALDRRLTARAENASDARSGLDGALDGAGVVDRNVAALLERARETTPRSATDITVAGAPPYLTTTEVRPSQAPGVTAATYPLATENHNLFTVSYGEAADEIASAVADSGEGVALRTGAAVLRAANRTLTAENGSEARSRLGRAVGGATAEIRPELVDALTGGPANVSAATAEDAVGAGLGHWQSAHERGLAAANGSAVGAVVEEVAARVGADAVTRDRWRVRLRVALRDAAEAATVDSEAVAAASDATRQAAQDAIASRVERGLRAVGPSVGASLNAVPAGLPVTPIPGYWWTTVNAWTVEVRGQYQRFAVSAPAGSPVPARDLTVVRENRTVAVDVDADGAAERLGANRPVEVNVSTTVVVAVPPGGSGVGDVDGNAVEQSPGWPHPGPTDRGASGS